MYHNPFYQYKFARFGILLYKIKMTASNTCRQCNKIDTLQHRLTSCLVSMQIWKILAVQLAQIYQRHTSAIVPTMLLLPQYKFNNKSKAKLINHLIGHTVWYILAGKKLTEEEYNFSLHQAKQKKI